MRPSRAQFAGLAAALTRRHPRLPRLLWGGACALLLLALGSCERRVPPLSKMPDPPRELLVLLPAPAAAPLTTGITAAAAALPTNPAYIETAGELERGHHPDIVQLRWLSTSVDRAVLLLRRTLREVGPEWPKGEGGPDWEGDDPAHLSCAIAMMSAYAAGEGRRAEGLALCEDGLRLAAYVGYTPGVDAEQASAQVERPIIGWLATQVGSGELAATHLQATAAMLEGYAASIRPLSLVLREGLSIANRAREETLPEEWASAVRSTWRVQSQLAPSDALLGVWDKWASLIRAADLPPAEARQLCGHIGPSVNAIELLYGPADAEIVTERSTRMRAIHRLRLEVAIARWEIAHQGSRPSSLELLVPAYLPSLPHDPTTGDPFRYQVTPSGHSLG